MGEPTNYLGGSTTMNQPIGPGTKLTPASRQQMENARQSTWPACWHSWHAAGRSLPTLVSSQDPTSSLPPLACRLKCSSFIPSIKPLVILSEIIAGSHETAPDGTEGTKKQTPYKIVCNHHVFHMHHVINPSDLNAGKYRLSSFLPESFLTRGPY